MSQEEECAILQEEKQRLLNENGRLEDLVKDTVALVETVSTGSLGPEAFLAEFMLPNLSTTSGADDLETAVQQSSVEDSTVPPSESISFVTALSGLFLRTLRKPNKLELGSTKRRY